MTDEFTEIVELTSEQRIELGRLAGKAHYQDGISWKEVRRMLRKHKHMSHLPRLERAELARAIYTFAKEQDGYKYVPGRDEIHEMPGYDA